MFKSLKIREASPELMDDFSKGGPELVEALRHLRRLNRIFNAAGPTLYGIKTLWRLAGKTRNSFRVDVGCGSGDVNRRLLRWADACGIDMRIRLMDITEEACSEARLFFRGEPRVEVVQGDIFSLQAQKAAAADIVTAGQFLHHFSDEELPQVTNCLLRSSRWGVVINDIHRHFLPWAAVWVMTRLISKNRYIRHDGPLSVAKGFRSSDWKSLSHALSGIQLAAAWIPLFRYAVVIRR